MKINLKKIHPDAILPTYGHPGDAGFDLYATETVTINPGELKIIGSGIAIAIPDGYVGLIWDKSGLANKHQLTNIGGVYDAGFRGEITTGLINLSQVPYTIEKGHKVFQMIIQERIEAEFIEVDDLGEASRGEGRHGSTGK